MHETFVVLVLNWKMYFRASSSNARLFKGCARAFGERLVSERVQSVTEGTTDDGVRAILKQLHHLFLADAVEAELGWFIGQRLVAPQDGSRVSLKM